MALDGSNVVPGSTRFAGSRPLILDRSTVATTSITDGASTASSPLLELSKMKRKLLVGLFETLEPPSVEEMHGEFRASLLDQGRWAHNFFTTVAFNLTGVWVSKSFQPITPTRGHGYNSFCINGSLSRKYSMQTYLGPSRFDDGTSYVLDYSAVKSQAAIPKYSKLRGEVRRLDARTFLGLGSSDFGVKSFHRAQPFLLEGPQARFVEIVDDHKAA